MGLATVIIKEKRMMLNSLMGIEGQSEMDNINQGNSSSAYHYVLSLIVLTSIW